MPTITDLVVLESQHCCNCDIVFAMSREFTQRMKETGGTFFCPNGHSQYYTETENFKLKKELEAKQRELTASKCETLAERQKREFAEAEMKRHIRRAKNGVCPCCKRTFVRLANHIATKHPEYGVKQNRSLP